MACPNPTNITIHQASRTLEISFEDGERFTFPFEFLRVYSPSAEVRGHGDGQAILQLGKQAVTIESIKPVGHYGICPSFNDGHNSGIYTWEYLYELGCNQSSLWSDYLDRVRQSSQAATDRHAHAPDSRP